MSSFNFKLIIGFTLVLVFTNSCHGYEELSFGSEEGLAIISTSRNFSVIANETVQLPCLISKQTLNTVVIWNQCEDPECGQVRSPLTINKDNFIEDLRFRVLFENLQESIKNGEIHVDKSNRPSRSRFRYRDAQDTNSYGDINKWTLEIRKFSKKDEGCYQCQLNSMDIKTIYYCIHLQKKAYAEPKSLTVGVHEKIHLKCHTDENVRMSSIKWYRNGHRLHSNSHVHINKYHSNDLIHTSLTIDKSTRKDTGHYSCRFNEIHARMDVHVDAEGGSRKHFSQAPSDTNFYGSDNDGEIDKGTGKATTSESYFEKYRFFAGSNARNLVANAWNLISFLLISSVVFIVSV